MTSDRCAKPGCGALRLVGKPCTDRDCPQIWVHHAETRHRERAAAAAAWLAAREAAVNAVKCGCRVISDWNPDGECACPSNCAEDDVIALHALPPPADAAAALAEVVRKAKREAFEEAAQAVEGSTAVTLRLVDPHVQKFHGDDRYRDVRAAYAAAIRARGEGGE
jgi:hypothetical protein